jgi:hypothetical protein
MNDVIQLPQHVPTKAKRKRKSVLTLYRDGETHPEEIRMADRTDWGIIFEDILMVKVVDGTERYFPTGDLKEWKVEDDGAKRKEEEGD